MRLTARERRVALLLGHGYGPEEVARRMGITNSAVHGFTRRMCERVCPDEQRDGRSRTRVVAAWAARNIETIQKQITDERATEWRELPPAVTEARLGVA